MLALVITASNVISCFDLYSIIWGWLFSLLKNGGELFIANIANLENKLYVTQESDMSNCHNDCSVKSVLQHMDGMDG